MYVNARVLGSAICTAVAIAAQGSVGIDVVTSAKACAVVRFAAAELTNFLSRATGEAVPIVDEPKDGRMAVLLGDAAGIDVSALPRDAFTVRVKGNRISIAGRDDPKVNPFTRLVDEGGNLRFERGTLFGVYDFLEREIGCRFYFPGEFGECVPHIDSLALRDGERTVKPQFSVRRWYDGYDAKWFGPGKDDPLLHRRGSRLNQLRLRMETSLVPCCHGQNAFRYVERFGKTHPEYFMKLEDGSRFNHPIATSAASVHGQICYSSGAMEELYQDVKAYLSGQPASVRGLKHWGYNCVDGRYVDIMSNDAFYPCLCGKCELRKSKADPKQYATEMVWEETAKIARRLAADGVSGCVTQMAYAPYRSVPSVDIPSNVLVMVAERGPWAKGDPAGMKANNDEIKAWNAKLGRPVWIWTYVNKYGDAALPGVPSHTPRAVGEYYKGIAPWVFGAFMECEVESYIYNHMNFYMLSRAAWDPSFDVEATMDEYYRTMYGPAAEAVKEFLEAIEDKWVFGVVKDVRDSNIGPVVIVPPETRIWGEIYTREFVDGARRGLEPFAAGDSLHARRVRLLLDEFLKPLEVQLSAFRERAARIASVRYVSADGRPMSLVPKKLVDVDDAVRTDVSIRRVGEEFIVEYRCFEPCMDEVKCTTYGRNDTGELWKGNCVEFFLNVSGDRKTYYQFIVSMNGELDDARMIQRGSGRSSPESDVSWNSGAKVATGRFDGGYTLEVRIPVKSFMETPAKTFPANFVRDRVLSGKKVKYDLYTWSPHITGYHDPFGFGTVTP